ncbi:MAG: VanZ family protein [Candidatus Brocadiae bacterium]|nr:VanZ family protein [Candidatus Brocadiia bacterium]
MDSSKKKNLYLFLYYWLIVLIFMGIIFYYSTTTLKIRPYYRHQDKTLHFLVYAVLGSSMARAFLQTFFRQKIWIAICSTILIASCFGALIEVCQIYCNRHFEVADIIANSLGSIAGSFFYLKTYRNLYPIIKTKIPILLKIEKYEEKFYGSSTNVL